jgi:ABC-type Fe3+-siderophore transport system permease subunit
MEIALGLFALAYSGLVLFILAASLRKIYPPTRAALVAFAISAAVHAVTTAFMGEDWLNALTFWVVPHLLILPLLLWSARRQGA